jgi:hypothetical protein
VFLWLSNARDDKHVTAAETGDNPILREFVLAVHPHVVLIYVELRLKEHIWRAAFSAFLMSVNQRKLIITAGHSVITIRDMRRAGYEFKRCYLVDFFRQQGIDVPIPFSWDTVEPWGIDRDGLDYGILYPYENLLQNLAAGGKIWLEENAWDGPIPKTCIKFLLVGAVTSDATLTEETGKMPTSGCILHRLNERPDDFPGPEPAVETLYATIGGHKSIVGLSGGGVFTLPDSGGVYQLVALQSRWIRADRQIAAPLVRPLGHMIRDCKLPAA